MYKKGLQNYLFLLFYKVTLIDAWFLGHKNPGFRHTFEYFPVEDMLALTKAASFICSTYCMGWGKYPRKSKFISFGKKQVIICFYSTTLCTKKKAFGGESEPVYD